MRILMPGPHRYWLYLLVLVGFSYVLVLSGLVDFLAVLHRWLAGPLSSDGILDGILVGVEVLLFADIKLILRCSGKHVEQLPVEHHGRTPALGKSVDRLFLLRSRDRYDLKTRLRKQGFFPGDFTRAGGSRFGCGYYCQDRTDTGDTCEC